MPRTRFQRGDQADSDCTPADDENKPLLSAQTGGNETLTAVIAAQAMNKAAFGFIMASGDPGSEDLGIDSLHRCQLDVTVAESQLEYKVRFVSLNDSCVEQSGNNQTEANFTGTGLKLGTRTFDPPVTERYGVLVLVTNNNGHSGASGTITIRTNNVNAFFEIPDAPPGADENIAVKHPRHAVQEIF